MIVHFTYVLVVVQISNHLFNAKLQTFICIIYGFTTKRWVRVTNVFSDRGSSRSRNLRITSLAYTAQTALETLRQVQVTYIQPL